MTYYSSYGGKSTPYQDFSIRLNFNIIYCSISIGIERSIKSIVSI